MKTFVIMVVSSLLGWAASAQTIFFANDGSWDGIDRTFTDPWPYLSNWGVDGQTDNCFWLPVSLSETNQDGSLPYGVHCQVQPGPVDGVFWNFSGNNQPLQSPYGRKFTFGVRFDHQNGYSLAGANEWDINLIQFWQWSTPWTDDSGGQHQWVNGKPEFMLWTKNGTYGRQFSFKIYTDVPNVSNSEAATEWVFESTTNLSVTLIDGNWHVVSVYGSLSTNTTHSCVMVYVDGVEVYWDKLTKTQVYANGSRGTPQVLTGPGFHITSCPTLPDYCDFRPRFGAYAYHKTGTIDQFRMFLDDIVISSANVW